MHGKEYQGAKSRLQKNERRCILYCIMNKKGSGIRNEMQVVTNGVIEPDLGGKIYIIKIDLSSVLFSFS